MFKRKNRKYIVILIMVAIIVSVVTLVKNAKGIQQKELSSENYSLKYDSTWEIRSSSENEIILRHEDTQSTLDISIAEIESALYGKSLEQIAENVKNKIEQEYKNYKCIAKSTTVLSENIGETYQLLFEDGKHQSLIHIGMRGYKIFISNYTAENKYFDILLDSVKNINSSFKIKDKTVALMDTRDIETTGVNLKQDDVNYSKVKEYEYSGSYYKIKYTIPDQYKRLQSSSIYRKSDASNSYVKLYIENDSIFEIYDQQMRDAKEKGYLNIEIDKITKNDLQGYYYKYNIENFSKEYCTFLLVIDNYNTIVINISDESITQNLIDNIKIESFERCGDYIDRTSVDGNFIGTLSQYDMYSQKEQCINVKYKVPDKYTEIIEPTLDLGAPECARSFIYGKLRNNEITESEWNTDSFYDYNITINIALGSADTIANKEGLTYHEDVQVGDITFKYYTNQYDSEGTTIKEAYFMADLGTEQNNKYSYRIYVSSLDDIPKSVLQDFANVQIEVDGLE